MRDPLSERSLSQRILRVQRRMDRAAMRQVFREDPVRTRKANSRLLKLVATAQRKLVQFGVNDSSLNKYRGLITDGPFNYTKNQKCSWLVDGSDLGASRVSLSLDSFVTECGWDHLFIYDGDGMYAPQIAALR